jgi:DNA-binding NarL/FixJ family response regulator
MGGTDRPIKILAVDDHAVLREGIAAIIQAEPDMILAGEASDGAAAVELFRSLRPDVTLMDLQMPGLSGVEAIKAIRQEYPGARIVVLTSFGGDKLALDAIKAGASGYLLKGALRRELLDTIRSVHAGRHRVQPEVAQEIAIHAGEDDLTPREKTVLRLVAAGKANKQIARELSLSEDTVKMNLKNIFSKLDVDDRTHAVIVAVKRGIIEI